MKRALWIIGLSVTAVAAVALTGLVGLVASGTLIMAPPDAARIAAVVPAPLPDVDPARPTVAVVLGDTRTEATDFLAPYAMFAESGRYDVYAVADTRAVRTLAGGVDVVPQLTFDELDARLGRDPDIIVVPAIKDIGSAANVPVLDWLRRHGHGESLLFSWCVGAEVLAESGLIDGRTVTTHWGDIDRLESAYPAVSWQRGQRYVDDGDLLTTGGITAGVDATLHLLAARDGQAVADQVAQAMHYPASPFVTDPAAATQYTLEAVDATVYLHMAFGWPKPEAAVWLYDGVGEVDLAAVVEAYGLTSTERTTTIATAAAVTSQHGLQLVPRAAAAAHPPVDRVLVPGGDGATQAAARIPDSLVRDRDRITALEDGPAPTYPFTSALQDLAATHDVMTAEYAARQLEVRSPLRLTGPAWPLHLLVMPLLAAVAGIGSLWAVRRFTGRVRGARVGLAGSARQSVARP